MVVVCTQRSPPPRPTNTHPRQSWGLRSRPLVNQGLTTIRPPSLCFWWPSPGKRGGESWRGGRRLGSENAPAWCRMTRVIGTRRRSSTTISKAGSIQSTKSSPLVILVTAVAKCRGLPRGMTWAARRTARFGLLVFLQPHRRHDVVQARAGPHQAPTGIHGMEYRARPAASACVVQRAGGAKELGAEAAEQQAAVGAGQ